MYETQAAFEKDVDRCQDYYQGDSLQPDKRAAAYALYQYARQGTFLLDFNNNPIDFGVTIIGRITEASTESFPGIDQAMKENLLMFHGVSPEHGSILDAKDWSLLGNDAWLLGGLHARTEFHFASPLRRENLWDEENQRMTLTAREVIGILSGGYQIVRPTALEAVAVCVDEHLAASASLLTYRQHVERYLKPEGLKELYSRIPDSAKNYE